MDTVLKKRMLLLLYDNPDGLGRAELSRTLAVTDEHLRIALHTLVMTPFISYCFDVNDSDCIPVYKLSQFGRTYVDKRRSVLLKETPDDE